jgi:Glucodextranase, domain B
MRRLVLVTALLACACGGGGAQPAAGPRVTLKLEAPNDPKTLRADRVQVRGTVSPEGARVEVNGEEAQVNGGTFVADVALQPGGNVIDVTATAPGRRPDADAVRVTRDIRVEIPQLVGTEHEAAVGKLRDLELDPREERGGNFLDRFIPGELTVCETQPEAGALVDPHSAVTVVVARSC